MTVKVFANGGKRAADEAEKRTAYFSSEQVKLLSSVLTFTNTNRKTNTNYKQRKKGAR